MQIKDVPNDNDEKYDTPIVNESSNKILNNYSEEEELNFDKHS